MSTSDPKSKSKSYQIIIQEELDEHWSDWFGEMEMTVQTGKKGLPVTVLTGHVDQAALNGILNRLWDLNLTVLLVKQLP